MPKKLSQRESSRLVTGAYLAARKELSHLTEDELSRACQQHEAQERDTENAPELIQVIRKYGVIYAIRGYTDAQIKAMVDAQRLVDRELKSPCDFVSKGSFAAGQANANGKADSYDHDEITKEATRLGYFDLRKGSHKRKPIRMEIVSNLRLRLQNGATSDESWDRLMRRILDEE